jgi:hypothetical protein
MMTMTIGPDAGRAMTTTKTTIEVGAHAAGRMMTTKMIDGAAVRAETRDFPAANSPCSRCCFCS